MPVQCDASRRGKKMLSSSRDKNYENEDENEGTYLGGDGGGRPAVRPPDLSYTTTGREWYLVPWYSLE